MSDAEFSGFEFDAPIEPTVEPTPQPPSAPPVSPELQARMERIARLDEALQRDYGPQPEPDKPLSRQEVEALVAQQAQSLHLQQEQRQILSQFHGNYPELISQQQAVFTEANAIFEYQKAKGQPIDPWKATQIAADRVRQHLQTSTPQGQAPAPGLKAGLSYSVTPMGQPVTPQVKPYDQMSRQEWASVSGSEAARLGITPVR